MINNPTNNVSTFVKVALPAIESTNKDGKYKVIADPNLDAKSILDVLVKYWDNDYLCNEMLTRFIRVVCDTAIRNRLAEYKIANPDADQESIDTAMQAYADAGWNQNLKHPATPKKEQSIAKNQKNAETTYNQMATDAKADFMLNMFEKDPELAKIYAQKLAEKTKK